MTKKDWTNLIGFLSVVSQSEKNGLLETAHRMLGGECVDANEFQALMLVLENIPDNQRRAK